MMLNKNHLKVFYDRTCPFCSFSATKIKKLDWFRKIEIFDANDEALIEKYQIRLEEALTRIQVVENEVTRAEGIDAIYLISKKLPVLWFFIPLIWLSIKVGWGMSLYDWIARNRFIFPTPGYCPTQVSDLNVKNE